MAKEHLIKLDITAAEALTNLAITLAVEAGDKLTETVETIIKAKEDWEGGPFACLFAMQKTYGDERLAEFPDPNARDGNRPSRFKALKTGTNGKSVEKVFDWYIAFADATPEGVRYGQEMEWLKRLNDPNDNHNGIPSDYVLEYGGNPTLIDTRKTTIERKRSVIRNAYRKAMELKYQFDAVNSIGEGVECEPMMVPGRADMIQPVAKPIMVWEPNFKTDGKGNKTPLPPVKWEYMSVGSFLRLDPAKAIEKGGSYQALIDTKKRETDKGAATAATSQAAPHLIRTPDTAVARIVDIHEYTDYIQSLPTTEQYAEFLKQFHGAGSDDAFISGFELWEVLGKVFKGDKARGRYDALTSAGEHKKDAA